MFLPFESFPEVTFVAIDRLHFLQQLDTCPDEEPSDLQAQIRLQARSMIVMEQAAIRLSQQQGIPLSEAKQTIASVAMPEPGQKKNNGLLFYQYFTAEEATQLLEATLTQTDRRDQAIKATTYLIRNRVAYPVKLRAIAEASTKPTELLIAPLAHPLADKQPLKFSEDCTVTIDGFHPVGSKKLKVKSVSTPLEDGSVGYLLDISTGDYRLGNSGWKEDHTRRYLTHTAIGKIYQFYLAEKAGISEWEAFNLLIAQTDLEEDSDESGKSEAAFSDDLPDPNPSNGDDSSGSSSITAVETSDLTAETLVASPAA